MISKLQLCEKMGEENLEKTRKQHSKPRVLNLFNMQVATPEFTDELRQTIGNQEPSYCYECIKCTSGCVAAKLQPEFRPHQIVGAARLGFRDQVLDSRAIWNCTTCNYCLEICPQDVYPTDVIRSIRRMAVGSGRILEEHRKVSKMLIDTGHLVPINEKYVSLRKEFGLPPLPPTTHTYPKALEEVKKIVETTGFGRLVGAHE